MPTQRFRYDLRPEDPERIQSLVQATGFFADPEIRVAEELARERIARGRSSGYHFVMAERKERLIGYACYGPIACTRSSYDLYWIAVHPEDQGAGWGGRLLAETERLVRKAGGTRIYVETSQREAYHGTRAFYEHVGYLKEAVLADFYAPGDGKAIFCKVLGRADEEAI